MPIKIVAGWIIVVTAKMATGTLDLRIRFSTICREESCVDCRFIANNIGCT